MKYLGFLEPEINLKFKLRPVPREKVPAKQPGPPRRGILSGHLTYPPDSLFDLLADADSNTGIQQILIEYRNQEYTGRLHDIVEDTPPWSDPV
jgi:hypothetical protein